MAKGKCSLSCIAKLLVLVGGLNWGLVGLSMLVEGGNWNLVNLLLGSWPVVEAVVYLLVGLSALWLGYQLCAMCKGGSCSAK